MDRKFLIELILEHSDKDDIRRIMRDIGTLEIILKPSFAIKLKLFKNYEISKII